MQPLKSFLIHFDSDLLKSLRWQYFLNIGIGILGAIYILALGRFLGADSFGTFTLCAAFPAVAAALLDCRLQEFVLYIRENCDKSRFPFLIASLFWLDAVAKLLVVGIALSAFALLETRGYEGINLEFVLLSSILVFVSKIFSGPAMGVLRSYGKLEYFSIVQVADWFFRLVALGVLLFVGEFDIPHVLWSQIMVGGLCNLVVIRRAAIEIELTLAQVMLGPKCVPRLLNEHARLIFANQGISATEAVVKELDVLVSGIYLTTAQVGTYKVAKSIAAIAWRLADPIFIVIMPKLARLHSLGRTNELNSFVRALALGLAPSAVLLFGTSVAGVLLLGPLVLGPEYAEAIRLYPLAAAWILISLPLVWTHSLAVASGKPVIQFLGSGLGNGIGLAAIWLGAWQIGIEGAMIGLSLAYCLPFVISLLLLRRLHIIQW